MRIHARRTVFYAVFQINKIPSASVPQQIERAPAEQTVEVVRVSPFVAGEVFAGLMGKVRIVFCLHGNKEKGLPDGSPF